MLESNSKQRLTERALDIIEECLLGSRRDSINTAKSKAEKTIIVCVLLELGANLLSSFNGLLGSSDSANSDSVCVDIAAGTASITVRNIPGSPRDLFSTLRGVVDGMAGLLRARKFSREDPSIISSVFCIIWRIKETRTDQQIRYQSLGSR